MDRTQMVKLLKTLLEVVLTEETRILTYGERGVLTSNEGLYIKLPKGEEFQITVIQNKFGEENKQNYSKKLRSSKTKKRRMDNPQSTDERNVYCRQQG